MRQADAATKRGDLMFWKHNLSALGAFLLTALALVPAGCKEEKPKPVGFDMLDGPGGPNPLPRPGPSKAITCAAFSPDGKSLLLGYDVFKGEGNSRREAPQDFLRLIDIRNGKQLR